MDKVMSDLERTLKRNMLKFHVGHEIFCPKCGNVLDVRRAVEVTTLMHGKPGKSSVVCAMCFDAVKEEFEKAFEEMKAQFPQFELSLEILDGRELFAKAKRAGKKALKSMASPVPVLPGM